MIQTQKLQNWSKFHLKLQKEQKISMVEFFFLNFEKTNQNKIYSKIRILALKLPEKFVKMSKKTHRKALNYY
jgi:hypothetical protein